MNYWPRRFFLLLISCIVLAAAVTAHSEDIYPKTPKAVMEKYLQLDSDAAGLSATTFPELGRYATWTSAPAWDAFFVIDHYELGKVLQGTTRAQALVTYQPLGKMGETFTPDTQREAVAYHLNKVSGEWKVDNPQLMPHVSWDVMKRRLETASTKDPKAKKANDALIAQILAAKQALQ